MKMATLGYTQALSALALGYFISIGATYRPLHQSIGKISQEKLGTLTTMRYLTILGLAPYEKSLGEGDYICSYRESTMNDVQKNTLLVCYKVGEIISPIILLGETERNNRLHNFEIHHLEYSKGSFTFSGKAQIKHNGEIFFEK